MFLGLGGTPGQHRTNWVSGGLGILEGCAAVELERSELVVGTVEDLEPVKAGKMEFPEPVIRTIEDTQRVEPANIKSGELVIVGVEALEFCQVVKGQFRELIEATIQVFETDQRPDLQVGQGVPMAIEADYLAVRGRVFVAGTRPKRDGSADGNRNLHGVADQGGAVGDLKGDKTGGGLGFEQVALDATV